MIDSKAIQAFSNEVMKPMFPKWDVKSAMAIYNGDETRAKEVSINQEYLSNRHIIDSPYSYNKTHTFVHYTSMQKCLDIIKDKKIRLYSLQGMDDIEEFTIAIEKLNFNLTEVEKESIKEKLFCFSMSEYDNEEKKNNLSLWRSFANDGNGVGIVFSIDSRKKADWQNYCLSKVYYNEKGFDKYTELINRYNKFNVKYDMGIINFISLLYRFFAFHKNNIYRDEREVRLLFSNYTQSFTCTGEFPIMDLNQKHNLRNYFELKLENELDEEIHQNYLKQNPKFVEPYTQPFIKIEKILFGYRNEESSLYDFNKIVSQYRYKYSHQFSIEHCALRDHFKK